VKYHTDMTAAELNRYQSEEDESRRKFDAMQIKEEKLRQFRLKYSGQNIWLHKCN